MESRRNKLVILAMAGVMSISLFNACGGSALDNDDAENEDIEIYVVSREIGSGTRDTFTELFAMQEELNDGTQIDLTSTDAHIAESTSEVITIVTENKNAIGYISLGSLDDTVKPLKIDGVSASVKNIKTGNYRVSRPFNIVTSNNKSPLAQDFIKYILSAQGQALIEAENYIPTVEGELYSSNGFSGTISIAGSSSMVPIMESLKEEYLILNPEVVILIKESDSELGIIAASYGLCDIGLASRDLNVSETEKGLSSQGIAYDGIVIIVHKNNDLNGLTYKTAKEIFTGEYTKWSYYSIFNLVE